MAFDAIDRRVQKASSTFVGHRDMIGFELTYHVAVFTCFHKMSGAQADRSWFYIARFKWRADSGPF